MTTISVELRVYIDLYSNGSFSDPNENVSAYVRAANWFIGWREPYQNVADTPTATITLDNISRTFSPEVPGSLFNIYQPLNRQVKIAVWRFDTNTEVDLWRGWIDKINVTPGQYTGDWSVTLHCVGHKAFIDKTPLVLPLQEAKSAPQIIDAVFDATVQPIAKSLQTGAFIYPYAGDTFDDYASGYDAIAAVTRSDLGRFWYDRSGTARFWNKTTIATTTAETYSNMPYQSLTYTWGRDLTNDVRVRAYPRSISPTNNETLWALQGVIVIPPGGSKTLRALFNDGTGAKVAGRNLQTPSANAGTLVFTGGPVSVSAFAADARGVEITLTNTGTSDATVTTLIVKGQKITALNAEETSIEEPASISVNGRRMYSVDMPLLYSSDLARNVAEYILRRRWYKPNGAVETLTLIGTAQNIHVSVMSVTVMSRITVNEYQTGHTGVYWVIGEEHAWTAGSRWETVYTVEPANTTLFWLVEVPGRSELNHTTILGL
jgi:hypothetical protein